MELTDALANTVLAYTRLDKINCPSTEKPQLNQASFYLGISAGRTEMAIEAMEKFINQVDVLAERYTKKETV